MSFIVSPAGQSSSAPALPCLAQAVDAKASASTSPVAMPRSDFFMVSSSPVGSHLDVLARLRHEAAVALLPAAAQVPEQRGAEDEGGHREQHRRDRSRDEDREVAERDLQRLTQGPFHE